MQTTYSITGGEHSAPAAELLISKEMDLAPVTVQPLSSDPNGTGAERRPGLFRDFRSRTGHSVPLSSQRSGVDGRPVAC